LNPKPQQATKVSNDLYFSLVSNKNFQSEMLPSKGLGPGPDEVGQRGLKVVHLWGHSQKIWFSLQTQKTCWVLWGFE